MSTRDVLFYNLMHTSVLVSPNFPPSPFMENVFFPETFSYFFNVLNDSYTGCQINFV